MKNSNIHDLVIVNEDSKTIHLGSGISGSCNLCKMESDAHKLYVVESNNDLTHALKRHESRGYRKCGHCFDGQSLPETILRHL